MRQGKSPASLVHHLFGGQDHDGFVLRAFAYLNLYEPFVPLRVNGRHHIFARFFLHIVHDMVLLDLPIVPFSRPPYTFQRDLVVRHDAVRNIDVRLAVVF